jgi:hypothetical protein
MQHAYDAFIPQFMEGACPPPLKGSIDVLAFGAGGTVRGFDRICNVPVGGER